MRNMHLLYQSSYDRGLEHLLIIWKDIKKKFPEATLDVAYGWNTFDALTANNPERQTWKQWMLTMLDQPGITEHGRIGKQELYTLREKCGILAYPSHFFEIFCIGAVEAQSQGCVPVTTNIGALSETVQHGVVVEGDITKKEIRDKYLEALMDLMGDENKRHKLAEEGKKFAKDFEWSDIAHKWNDVFEMTDKSVKLTVYTPTIRKGWWNIMAWNLSLQTYRNFEWLIVDDAKEDRSKLAAEYAKKYKLDIKYMKGKSRNGPDRNHGISNANNTAVENASGDVLVFLQDFILIPEDGLEQIAIMYRKNPEAIQALPDMYFSPKIKPDTTKEDWFNGETDVVGEFLRKNIRIQNQGLRETVNPFDSENNWGAIPMSILQELGGYWEFMDDGVGWDNTEFAWRALRSGYKILLDETNVAICIDHWEALKGTDENIKDRDVHLNDPRYLWMTVMTEGEQLPLKRNELIDMKISLQYEVPKELKTGEEQVKWLKDNTQKIVEGWIKKGVI